MGQGSFGEAHGVKIVGWIEHLLEFFRALAVHVLPIGLAGIDLLALRELMGHASPETTSRYVHLSVEHLAAEYAAARATMDGAR